MSHIVVHGPRLVVLDECMPGAKPLRKSTRTESCRYTTTIDIQPDHNENRQDDVDPETKRIVGGAEGQRSFCVEGKPWLAYIDLRQPLHTPQRRDSYSTEASRTFP